jgi:predicted transposase/invertase (TIGR01784 family)
MAKRQKKSRNKAKEKAINPHDAFFKSTFSYPEIAREYIGKFLNANLVKNIDLDSLVLESTSFVVPELTEYFSDLVWQARYKTTNIKISFLFEHKSYLVRYPHPQLLRYILEHINVQIQASEPLTVVIPIVIYHGDKEWKMRPFADYFEGVDEELRRFIPSFDYNLTSLSNYSDEQLIDMGIGKLVNVFLAMNHVRNVGYILNNYETIFIHAEKDLQKNKNLQFFQTIFFYLYKNIEMSSEQLETIVTTVNSPLKKFTMSAYDLLIEKGMEKGMEKGINLENIRKTKTVVLNLFTKFPNWTDSQIAEIADTTVEFVQQMRTQLN